MKSKTPTDGGTEAAKDATEERRNVYTKAATYKRYPSVQMSNCIINRAGVILITSSWQAVRFCMSM